MRAAHQLQKIKYALVEQIVGARKLLILPQGDTLHDRLPLVKIEQANRCDKGHISKLKRSVRRIKCFVPGCESQRSQIVSVQTIGRKNYFLRAAVNLAATNPRIDRAALSALSRSELNQNAVGERETRSANPVDRIFSSFDDVFPPALWTEDVIKVNYRQHYRFYNLL
jgi:hypothetical protein